MTKVGRIKRSTEDLEREMIDQLKLLRHSCESFDKGLDAVGKHIALSLRVLVHEHGQSKALLEQLGLRSTIRFFDSAGPLNPNNLISESKLLIMRITPSGAHYLPIIAGGEPPIPMRKVSFLAWWNEPVLKDNSGRTFCRRQLILNVADTDGGAHVDPELDEAYMDLSRENSLGWK